MEEKTFALKLRSLGDRGAFTGTASTYGGEPDLVGDTIRKGAFAKTIQQNQGKVRHQRDAETSATRRMQLRAIDQRCGLR